MSDVDRPAAREAAPAPSPYAPQLEADVGNTNICFGLFVGPELRRDWRVRTMPDATSDELEIILRGLFAGAGLGFEQLEGFAVASVVPALTTTL